MAKKNFGFEKRQKELKKKQKQEEKRLRKLERASAGLPEEGVDDDREEGDPETDPSEDGDGEATNRPDTM